MDGNVRKKMDFLTRVPTKEYTIQIGDTFWKIAEKELSSGHRWTAIYELNKKKIEGSNRLKAGQKIIIPVK